MSPKSLLKSLIPASLWLRLRALRNRSLGLFWYERGYRYAKNWSADHQGDPPTSEPEQDNPLWQYFQNHHEGPGVWKWEHYFPVYHRHLEKFIGRNPKIVEVGIFSGGSLRMWAKYFGGCEVYGVDIEEACRVYESEHVHVFIGDQADRGFWAQFRKNVPKIDVLIDDGGHLPQQQRVTLECMLPHLRNGGVYICEDVGGIHNLFATYATGIVGELNRESQEGAGGDRPSEFQRANFSIHFYPYMVVIERADVPIPRLQAPKHGSEWQPFLDKQLPQPVRDTRGT
jgi:hypothetical protein